MRRFLLITSALVSTGVGVGVAMPAYAQEAAEGASEDNTIVVTARKREENLIDVPLAISVATAAQLERDQVYNLNDLQRITPALEISQTSGGETNGGGRLRGLGTGVFNPSVSSSVALIVDQAPIGNLSFPQLFDVGQVEVLRGPQGTLFGQGASAGVLNVSTKAPSTDGPKGSFSVDFADKGTVGSEVGELVVNSAFNVPLGEQAAIRVASQYKRETGLQRSTTTGDNKITDYGIRIRALLKPSEAVTVNLSAEYGENKSDGQTFFAIAVTPNSTAPFGPPGGTRGGISTGAFLSPTGCAMTVISARAEEYCEALPSDLALVAGSIGAVIDWEVSDSVSISSVTSYRERTFNQFSRDFSRLSTAFAARQELTQENSHGFSQELRANFSSDNFDLIVGGYYNDFRFDRVPYADGPFRFGVNAQGGRIGFSVCSASGIGFCPVNTSFTKERTSNRTLAGFADATLKLSDQFGVFGGIRVSDYKNSTGVGTNTLIPTSTTRLSEGNVSGRVGVSFRPSSNTNIFGSFARGYKPSAVGTNPAGALFVLRPEKTDAIELGAKGRIGGLQVAANLFHTTLVDFQSQTSVFVGTALVSQPLNIPKLKSKGFELTAMGEILPGFNVNTGYQYNDIKFPAGYLGDDGGALGGTQFLNAPKHKFTISGDYGLPLGDSMELFLNANLIYKTKVLLAARADPRYRYPAHEIINLGFGFRHPDGDWNASLFVRNLTKEREPTAYLASTFAGAADGGIRAWPIAGLTARVVGVRAGFEF